MRVAAVQATPVILDSGACIEKAVRLLEEAAGRGVRLAVLPETFVPLYPSNAWARSAAGFSGWDELWERLWENAVDVPGPLVEELRGRLRAARPVLRDRGQRARGRPSRLALQHAAADRAGGAAAQAPQADADPARAALPRDRRGPRPRRRRDRDRPRRRADLLGEPDAAGALRRLPRRAADLGRADRRRLRRLARLDAPHRDRVRGVRRLGPAVHPGRGVPRRLPGPDRPRARLRARRRGDRRAGRGAR